MSGNVRFNKELHRTTRWGSGGSVQLCPEVGLRGDAFREQMALLQKWVGRWEDGHFQQHLQRSGCERELSSFPSGSEEALPQCLGGESRMFF